MFFDQRESAVRFEWGLAGLEALAPESDVIVIVDVLSFTTSVDIVVANGGVAFPYRGTPEALPGFARDRNAHAAPPGRTAGPGFTLAPSSLVDAPPGTRVVLPSPNGSLLSLSTGDVPTLAGCLRNAASVARRARELGQRITVIAAGERWPDRSLRPALEDLLGAGAIITHLPDDRSPEAELARCGFQQAEAQLLATLSRCGSGRELIGRGFSADVALAAQLNVSRAAPHLVDGAYVDT